MELEQSLFLRHFAFMKTVRIDELDSNTGQWLREASRHQAVVVPDGGKPLVTVLTARPDASRAGFRARILLPEYQAQEGKLGAGTDSTTLISEDHDRNVPLFLHERD